MTLQQRYDYIIGWFTKNMPVAETELQYQNPYELLVAVILSAQCTDKRVNMITPAFFQNFPDVETLAASQPAVIYESIKSVSYPNSKAKHLAGMARMLVEEFGGIVPDNVEMLQTLPGVGRKTANVIASVVYDKPVMAVDTHVFRVSERLGLTENSKNPLQTERELTAHISPEIIPKAHHWLILHGRYVCKARRPECESCGLTEWCRWFQLRMKN